MWKYLLERLGERSTWLGILAIITVAGISISPDQQEAITNAGVAVAAAIGVFTKG